jgi:hypothetical protein
MIAIKSQEGDVVFFDVVTRYSQSFRSQLTQHPVDGAGTVSDHVVKQNPQVTLSGIISGADFNQSKPQNLSEEQRNRLQVGASVIDPASIASIIEIKSEDGALNLLPGSVSQFTSNSVPTIENLSEGRGNEKDVFTLLKGYSDRKEAVNIYEFDDVGEGMTIVDELPEKPSQRVYITNLSKDETAQQGDALTVNMTFQIATVTTLQEEEVPANMRQDVQDQAATGTSKGNQGANSNEIEDYVGDAENPSGILDFLLQLRGG